MEQDPFHIKLVGSVFALLFSPDFQSALGVLLNGGLNSLVMLQSQCKIEVDVKSNAKPDPVHDVAVISSNAAILSTIRSDFSAAMLERTMQIH